MHQIVSWIHFGDLHISNEGDQNYADLLALTEEANRFGSGIAFGFLPGDNADDGEEDQYALVKKAISPCRFPVHAIPGDHDVAGGSFDLFRAYLSDALYRSFTIDGNRFVLLNSVCNWKPPAFGLGSEQMSWLRKDLAAALENKQRIVVFMHAYPSEHEAESRELAALFKRSGVLLVEMGHTHYNEIANDGQMIYAATRSTGQVEEGPPGFSVGSIDGGVVSWKFKPLGELSLVVITSPGDERLIIDASSPTQVVRGTIPVHARVWNCGIEKVTMAIGETALAMKNDGDGCTWIAEFDSTTIPDGSHVLEVTAVTSARSIARDRITILVNQQGHYTTPQRRPLDYENALGEWADKHVLGTQLGPNEQGRHWPSRHERERPRP